MLGLRWDTMSSARIPVVDIETLAQFDEHLAATPSLHGCVIQSVDLANRRDALAAVPVSGAIFLGCPMPRRIEDELTNRGGLVFPRLPHLPFNPYRANLYSATELYDGLDGDAAHGGGYAKTLDGRVYAWYTAQGASPALPASLAMALHDQAISDALNDIFGGIEPRKLVSVMGGHSARRGDDDYRRGAQLGANLARGGFVVMTGGGPGLMEAVNLGARLAGSPDAVDDALGRLAAVPDTTDVAAWAEAGLDIAAACPPAGPSFGIPTWFYGHEPPNVFPTHIAKYFSNAQREDILLNRAQGGIVILPGAAGTVQEIFQCATRDFYAPTASLITPVVLVGRDYWTRQLPAWPLLRALGQGRAMGDRIALVDTVDEVTATLASEWKSV